MIWFALLIAPAISGGLSEIVSALPAAMNNPFKIVWCEDSVKTVLIFIAAYGLGIGVNKKRIDFYKSQLELLKLGLEDKIDLQVAVCPAASVRPWRCSSPP